ncbi:hypothetical protein NQ315_010824 [Exocentrus adspersus]|uniref:Uncharacterized protein n=1 Tax=Exocentrus adspersus TaxID=1586481 RepID=A0AAV8V687_9CUCU|nr:hypothetical protein NQ315_010824 [Exocentrus adspersus]
MNCSSENNEEIAQLVSEAESSLLPVKSRAKYEKSYQLFCHWRNEKDVQGASEDILIAYFCEKVKILKASTLWSLYSMVKSTLQINENVDISAYKKLLAYLKRQNDNYLANTLYNYKPFNLVPYGHSCWMRAWFLFYNKLNDVILLADIFENFKDRCLKTYGLDPAHYHTPPGYIWDCMLKLWSAIG